MGIVILAILGTFGCGGGGSDSGGDGETNDERGDSSPGANCDTIHIDDPEDLVYYSSCVTATNLKMGDFAGEVVLPNLNRVTRDVSALLSKVTTIRLPNLVYVGHSMSLGASSVESIVLPSLETVGGDFTISSAENLTEVELERLREVGTNQDLQWGVTRGNFDVSMNDKLSELNLPFLENVTHNFQVSSNDNLRSIYSPFLSVTLPDYDWPYQQLCNSVIYTMSNHDSCHHDSPMCQWEDCLCD